MIIAIDVGGTKISAALIARDEIIEQRKMDSVIHHNLANLAKHLVKLCHDWLDKANQVTLATTGQVSDEYVNFLTAKQKLPLKSQLEKAFNLPVSIMNDASAAAWAEYHVIQRTLADNGSGSKKHTSLVYITVSTGVGGGIIQNEQLVNSSDGFCTELGHVSVQNFANQKAPCHCGRVNCIEAIASGTAIAKQASLILNKQVTCKEVFQTYSQIPEIAQLIEQCSSSITDLIASVKAITGTSHVVLGGSVGSSAIFFQQVKKKVTQLPDIYQVSLLAPACGADADLWGAYWHLQDVSMSN